MGFPHGPSFRFVTSRRVFGLSFFVSSTFALPLTLVFSRFVCRRQELEGWARERYGALDCLYTELS
jgi:hypothetical protein